MALQQAEHTVAGALLGRPGAQLVGLAAQDGPGRLTGDLPGGALVELGGAARAGAGASGASLVDEVER